VCSARSTVGSFVNLTSCPGQEEFATSCCLRAHDLLADFALGDWGGFEVLLGSSTRLTGQHKRFTQGLAWYPATPGESLLYLRPLGDVDGDGMAELRVTIISKVPENEVADRGPRAHHRLLGRRTTWRLAIGNWDPTWAVAMLGDEPPAFEDNGASTVLQRLTIVGTGERPRFPRNTHARASGRVAHLASRSQRESRAVRKYHSARPGRCRRRRHGRHRRSQAGRAGHRLRNQAAAMQLIQCCPRSTVIARRSNPVG